MRTRELRLLLLSTNIRSRLEYLLRYQEIPDRPFAITCRAHVQLIRLQSISIRVTRRQPPALNVVRLIRV
jgi:hypothetical protein